MDEAALLLAAQDILDHMEDGIHMEDTSTPPASNSTLLATAGSATSVPAPSSAPLTILLPTTPPKFAPVGSFARPQQSFSTALSTSCQNSTAPGEAPVVKKSSAEWCAGRLKWRGIQCRLQDQPLVELMKGLTAARTADAHDGSPRAKRVRSAREALRALREADRLVGGRAMPLPPPKPPAPPPEPPRVPDLPPLLARPRNPVPLLIAPLLQRKEEQQSERPAAERPDDQQEPEGEQTHKTL